ncbi:LysR family transcriptional regulator [Candidatus Albibeggiatoa sp. nov. NOAA]|uniref:LysR family transcriptional regulator n=1 Tax=Candidatus Albibeggiatoa sp. nov. NOAA TaxID=3162724 RepID=UPI0032FF9AA2|nr:LysR family transcriptional regulator [Thiotrichaceae bacterium]
MDLNAVVIFNKVVECQSFTEAARQLSLPKSTVSRKISELEDHLGARLLQRTTRKITLTELGAEYYANTASISHQLDDAARVLRDGQLKPSGRLRVTAPVEMQSGMFLNAIFEYMEQYPDVNVDLELSSRYIDLVQEGFDLAIRGGKLDDSSLVAIRFISESFNLYAHKDYFKDRPLPQHPSELKDEKFVLYQYFDFKGYLLLTNGEQRIELPVQSQLQVNSHLVMLQYIAQHKAIGSFPQSTFKENPQADEFICILPEWEIGESLGLYFVYPSNRHVTAKMRSFIDFLKAKIIV